MSTTNPANKAEAKSHNESVIGYTTEFQDFESAATQALGIGATWQDTMNFMKMAFDPNGKWKSVPEQLKMMIAQQLDNKRQQLISLLTQMMRSFHETAMRIIGNIGR